MSRPVGPGGAGGGVAAAWVVPAVGAVLPLCSAATWVAGTLAAWHQNAEAGRAPFRLLLVLQAGRDGTESLWPGTSPTLVWTLTGCPDRRGGRPGARSGAAVGGAAAPGR